MRARLFALVLTLVGLLGWSLDAKAVLFVTQNTHFVNAGESITIISRITNNNGQFRVAGPGVFCFTFSSVTGCNAGTVLGTEIASKSTVPNGFVNGFDAVVTIPEVVLNRVQQRVRTNPTNALFFVVFQLIPAAGVNLGNGANVPFFVQINFRFLGGSSGAKALTITKIKLIATEPGYPEVRNTIIDEHNRDSGEFCLEIWYTGSGQVQGWWQLWTNSHPPLTDIDLMTEASLPENQRRLQRRFFQLKRIREYFGPSGYIKLTLPYSEIPEDLKGQMLLFPRFLATWSRRSQLLDTNALVGNRSVKAGLTFGGKIPTHRVLNSIPEGAPYELLTNAGYSLRQAPGETLSLVVVWTAASDTQAVVEVRARDRRTNLETMAIAPLGSNRLAIDLQGAAPEDLDVSLTVRGSDGRVYPNTESMTLSQIGPAPE